MRPFTKILVAHDFSEHAKRALEAAAEMARRYEARLCIVHVHQPYLTAAPDAFLLFQSNQLPTLLEALEQQLAAAKHDASAAGALQVETKLLQGVPTSEITRFARENACDLIVMGTHGRTGLAHALIGSVAERVVRNAPCPVLTLRLQERQEARD